MGSFESVQAGASPVGGSLAAALDDARVRAQMERGFRRLRFEPRLEDAYLDHLHRRLLRRIPLVSLTALVFFAIYSVLDYLLFPLTVFAWTIPIRLFVVCPVVLLVTWAAYRGASRNLFLWAYSASYAVGGMAIVAIIFVAHSQKVMMPYDGLFLVLMFGYFLMAMPFYPAVAISWVIYLVYLAVEWAVGLPMSVLLYNSFFLLTANLIGTVGSYIQEHAYRTNFLNLCLIRASRQRAEEENRAKTKFLATASHDLRQPLHAMNLMLAHLDERLQGAEENRIVGKIKQSVELLNQLLRSLLDISRLNVGVVKPKYQHFSLSALLARLSVDFDALAEEQGVTFRAVYPRDCYLYSDPVLIERLLRNLLSNAFKHSQASEIELRVEAEGGLWLIRVIDNGKGIAEEELDQIFLEFHQGSAARQIQGSGLGLGLAIVKHLALLMDYDYGVESALGQGARFWIRVPKGLAPTEASAEPSISGVSAATGQCILLVENDQVSLDAMRTLLSSWGFQVQGACDQQSARDLVKTASPDLIISDYRLGADQDGLALIATLRDQLGWKVPAILVTADTELGLPEEAGKADVLVAYKPLVPAQLRLMMRRQLMSAVR